MLCGHDLLVCISEKQEVMSIMKTYTQNMNAENISGVKEHEHNENTCYE